jgi:anti-anti-sigma regulatory factor
MSPGKGSQDDVPLVVEIRGEIDVFSAPQLRDELLRTIRRRGPRLIRASPRVRRIISLLGLGWAFGLR